MHLQFCILQTTTACTALYVLLLVSVDLRKKEYKNIHTQSFNYNAMIAVQSNAYVPAMFAIFIACTTVVLYNPAV